MPKIMKTGPVRVVNVLGSKRAGGAETFFIRLAVALHGRKDVAQTVVVRENSWAARQLAAAGVSFEALPFGGLWDALLGTTRRRLRGLCLQKQVQVVVAFMNRAAMHTPMGPWVNVGRLGGYYDLKYYRGKMLHLIGNTKDLVRYCVGHGWPAGHVHYLPNFIPAPSAGWEKEGAAVRKRLGILPTAKVGLVAARLHPVKGHATVLRALAGLPKDFHVIFAGDGKLEAELRDLASSMGLAGRVHGVGWADAVSGYAAAADVWLVPSTHEPLGNSVLDAWAHGVPVISTRTAGPVSLITDGKDGLLVDIDDAEGLAAAWRKVAGDAKLSKALAAAGARVFARDFCEDVVVGAYVKFYQDIVI